VFGRYGVRVPALIVSPWVEPRSVSTTLLDHTSVIKTILLRFCPDALNEPERHQGLLARARSAGRPRYLGTRVAHAHDLGELLTRTAPRPAPARYALIHDAAARAAARTQGAPIDRDALGREPATDLQIRIAAAMRELRRRGHPANQP
jgi:phospholipase C